MYDPPAQPKHQLCFLEHTKRKKKLKKEMKRERKQEITMTGDVTALTHFHTDPNKSPCGKKPKQTTKQ